MDQIYHDGAKFKMWLFFLAHQTMLEDGRWCLKFEESREGETRLPLILETGGCCLLLPTTDASSRSIIFHMLSPLWTLSSLERLLV